MNTEQLPVFALRHVYAYHTHFHNSSEHLKEKYIQESLFMPHYDNVFKIKDKVTNLT